jgi:hypothetical protein
VGLAVELQPAIISKEQIAMAKVVNLLMIETILVLRREVINSPIGD